MPELPEVETVTRALSKVITNCKIILVEIQRDDLRWKIPKSLKLDLKDDSFGIPYRKGKYILNPTKKGNVLLIHLGMSGQIKIKDNIPDLVKHDHFRIIIRDKNNQIFSVTYNDPRRFGYIDCFKKGEIKKHFLLKNLGLEPFEDDLTSQYLFDIFKRKKINIKTALLDQRIIAGIGNIYANEILFRAGIRPEKKVSNIKFKSLKLIINSAKEILLQSINKGGTTIKDHKQPDGKLGYFKQNLQVYGRDDQKCRKCSNNIKLIVISNRSTFFCSKCQK